MEHLELMTRVKTHQSHRTPADLIPKLTDFLVFVRKLFADNNDLNPANIFAMDETAVWFDATSNRTVNAIGARTISMDKQNVTVALTASASGAKRLPFVLVKGKVKTAEDRELQARRDIVLAFSDNGWFNKELTIDWRQRVMGSMALGKRLLVWNFFIAGISPTPSLQRGSKNAS